ncbi:MAG TPA: hypothetical protein PKM63_16375 [Panacibacter sp.]|nr:hypothetical protein [Panacibacter sp.]HNP45870.1 hypothetical protein [Panacibacter sp.]
MKRSFLVAALLLVAFCGLKAQDSTVFAEFYGKFEFKDGGPLTEASVEWLDNQLYLTTSMGNASMTKIGLDSFSISYADGIVVFKRDSSTKKISGLTIFVTGMVLDAAKAEPEKSTGLIRLPAKKEEPIAIN